MSTTGFKMHLYIMYATLIMVFRHFKRLPFMQGCG